MKYTIKDLKEYINNLPDDYEVWLEWVDEPARPLNVETSYNRHDGGTKFLECMSLGYHPEKKRFYIFHHY